MEHLPLPYGEADLIFNANLCQYFPNPVATFVAIGPYLRQGGRLVVMDEDIGMMHFYNVNLGLQTRVLQAHMLRNQEQVACGYPFEDHRVGSKLAGYLRAAGYKDVREKRYRIKRSFPLSEDCRFYLEGTAEWLASEGTHYLSHNDKVNWLQCSFDSNSCVLDREDFAYEETEYVVSGVWTAAPCNR